MKKLLSLLLVAATICLCACGGKSNSELVTFKVGASTTPHAEILEVTKEYMKSKGYDLQIVEFSDYVLPNSSLEDGSIDANYFQHQPFLDDYNANNNGHLVSVAAVHYEPFGIYPGKTATLAELPDGAQIAVPNDGSNEARALLLLEEQGLIKLKEGAGITATKNDIVENPHNYDIVELNAEQVARSLQDVNVGVINGNNALVAGLNVSTDSIAKESKESEQAVRYANILVVKEGNESNPAVLALIEALKTEEVKKFIEEKYNGAVVVMF